MDIGHRRSKRIDGTRPATVGHPVPGRSRDVMQRENPAKNDRVYTEEANRPATRLCLCVQALGIERDELPCTMGTEYT